MVSVCAWCVAYAGELSSLKLETMLFWLSLEYAGVATLPVFWLILALLYSGREKFLTVRNIVMLFIVPVMIIALVATNQLHHFVYSAVSADLDGPFPMLSLTRGPGYWINMFYSYFTLMLGAILLLTRLNHPRLVYRKQIIAMLIALLFPWALNLLYQIFNITPLYHLDLTPYGFAVTGLIIAWAMYRYQLFDITPAVRARVLEIMGDGLIVLDLQGKVIDANRSAAQLLGWSDSAIGKPAMAMLAGWPELLQLSQSGASASIELPGKVLNKYYEITVSDLSDSQGEKAGNLMLLHDITDRKKAEEELRDNEEKYHSFFRTVRDAVFMTTTDGRWLEINEESVEMFGYADMQEMKSVPVISVYAKAEQRKELTESIAMRGFVKDMLVTFQRKDGSNFDALLTAAALKDKSGSVIGFQGTVKDITEIKQAQAALAEVNAQLQRSLLSAEQRNSEITLLGEMAQRIQSSQNMTAAYLDTAEYLGKLFAGDSGFIAEINVNDQVVEVKASFGTPAGKSVFMPSDCFALQKMEIHESDGSDPSSICPHIGDFPGCFVSMPLITAGGVSWLLHLQRGRELVTAEACKQWTGSRKPLMLSAGQELAVALSNVRLRETLRDQAVRDPLTGLYNRRYMEEMLDQQLHSAKRIGYDIGFIMADLDHFKEFNDRFGHEAGDLLLKAVANRIKEVIRLEDIGCRYGGEEFLIILPHASLEDTHARALQIQEEIRNISFSYDTRQLGNITISMGVSAFPNNGDDVSVLVRAADLAMYQAKKDGRDRVVRKM